MQQKCSCCYRLLDSKHFGKYKTCEFCRAYQAKLRKTDKDKNRKKKYYIKNKDKAKEYGYRYRRTDLGRFKKVFSAAKRAKILFSLNYEQYLEIISKSCYYCNGYFPRVVAGSGLDRIQPENGYCYENCLSCCDVCNTLKNSEFTVEETKAAIKAILKLRKKK